MPRGKKTCPKCNTEHGPRTHKCGCGYEFFKSNAAATALREPMIVDHKQIISDAKSTIPNIEPRSFPTSVTPSASSVDCRKNAASTPFLQTLKAPYTVFDGSAAGRYICTPAGVCSVKPTGFKNYKWEEPWTEDIVKNWAMEVYSSGPPYLPEAVIYFARYFWDINGSDFKKIRSLILEALIPKKSHEFNE